jgi:hypothetical protein
LEKTQAAAGEVELYEMQQKLIDLRNKEKELTKVIEHRIMAYITFVNMTIH